MKHILLAGTALLAISLCSAEDIKPFDAKLGLWETTTTTQIGGMPAMPAMPQLSEEQLSRMPAQQRAQIESMMKGGVGAPRTATSKTCMTKDTVNKALALGQDQKQCKSTVKSATSTKQEIHVECTQNNMSSIGDMTVERIDAEHVKGNMVMKAGAAAQSMDIKMSFTSKWVATDCGDVKPL